jgi:hypothetical protein
MGAREVAERLRKLRKSEKLATPEGDVYVRGLTGAERQVYMEKFNTLVGVERLTADQHLVALALSDENSAALFEDFDTSFQVVQDWPTDLVTEGAKIVCRLSGLAPASEDEAEKK